MESKMDKVLLLVKMVNLEQDNLKKDSLLKKLYKVNNNFQEKKINSKRLNYKTCRILINKQKNNKKA